MKSCPVCTTELRAADRQTPPQGQHPPQGQYPPKKKEGFFGGLFDFD